MELLLATNNDHKVKEFNRIFKQHRLFTPTELGLEFDYAETGTTFHENALGKARALYRMTGRPVLADDSGLCVTALDNAPGVFSARYGAIQPGTRLKAEERNALLLQQLQAQTNRQAFFVCCMACVVTEHRFFVAQETVEGVIAHEPAGDGGFGYDPVFLLPEFGLTVAQLEPARKDSISHRGKAARVINTLLAAIQ